MVIEELTFGIDTAYENVIVIVIAIASVWKYDFQELYCLGYNIMNFFTKQISCPWYFFKNFFIPTTYKYYFIINN